MRPTRSAASFRGGAHMQRPPRTGRLTWRPAIERNTDERCRPPVFAAILLLIVGTLNIIYGSAQSATRASTQTTRGTSSRTSSDGVGPRDPRRVPADRRVLAPRRKRLGRVIGIIAEASARSTHCCRWAEPIRSGRLGSSRCACGSSTESPSSDRTNRPRREPDETGSPAGCVRSGSSFTRPASAPGRSSRRGGSPRRRRRRSRCP